MAGKTQAQESVNNPLPKLRQEFRETPLLELKLHPRNARKGSVTAILDSIQENGFFGACVAQKSTGHILVGNHRYLAARENLEDTVPVLWVDVDDKRALKILLADNRTNDLAGYDNAALAEVLADLANTDTLDGTGYSQGDLDALIDQIAAEGDANGGADEPQKYTANTDAPIYEPKGDRPELGELYDLTNTRAIEDRIQNSDAPEDVKAFLLAAAQRHTVIRFDRVAEYYAHAPADVQRLFEDQALVIVDFDSAIEKGWAKLTKTMSELYEADA